MKKKYMKKKVVTIITAIICLIIVVLCFKHGYDERLKKAAGEIVVKSEDEKIDVYKGDCVFKKILEGKELENLYYVENEKKIEIEFFNETFKNLKVREYIINKKGDYRFKDKGTDLEVEKDGRKASFVLKPNMLTLFSSLARDYQKGNTIKGYSIEYEMYGEKFSFSFVIRGDAAINNAY